MAFEEIWTEVGLPCVPKNQSKESGTPCINPTTRLLWRLSIIVQGGIGALPTRPGRQKGMSK